MTFVSRLRDAVAPLYDDEWGDCVLSLNERIPANLLTMRRIRFRAVMLKRVEDASRAWSLEHMLRMFYRGFRKEISALMPLTTPFLTTIKKKTSGSTIRWGQSMYFDLITQRPKVVSRGERSKFWRDPFVAAS